MKFSVQAYSDSTRVTAAYGGYFSPQFKTWEIEKPIGQVTHDDIDEAKHGLVELIEKERQFNRRVSR